MKPIARAPLTDSFPFDFKCQGRTFTATGKTGRRVASGAPRSAEYADHTGFVIWMDEAGKIYLD